MRKAVLLLAGFMISGLYGLGQVVEVTANPGTSATPLFGTSNFAANESIYTEAELGGPGNFTAAGNGITQLGFNINTVGTPTSFGSVRIYMKDVPAATTTLASGTYTTSGYTQVFNGTVNLTAAGWTEITLTTPFVRTAGNNLQVLIERADGVTHAGFVYNCAVGNNVSSTAFSTRRYNSTTALSGATSLTQSSFRQALRFARRFNNDAKTEMVYTLGKVPTPNGVPVGLSASILNEGLNAMTNVNVTVTVTGANSYTNTQVIPSLAALTGRSTVSFPGYNPVNEGTNNISVSVAADDNASNNTFNLTQLVNKNTWSYAYGTTASGGVGFNGATGDFVAKFNTNAATSISQVTVNFFAGGQPYKIGIWDATGVGGAPGALIWESATLTALTGANVLPVSPIVNLSAGNFFVGVRQTGTTNVSFAYQTETPIRASTFYFTSPTGGTTWTDFSPANSFRFMIEPKLILPVDASVSNFTVPAIISCNNTSTYSATLTNTGTNAIAAGAASVTLKIGGANTYTATLTNTNTLATGATETITFTGVNTSNGGTNLDTLFVSLASDGDKSNDTLKTTNLVARNITSFPNTESFENATLDFGYLSVLAGGRNLISLNTGPYTNGDLGGNLNPQSGNRMIIFDNYSGANSVGVLNRLFSDCFTIPAAGAGLCSYKMSFWMSHDASFSTDLDSLFVTISTDKGLTWNRLTPGYGRYDAAFTTPGWKKETIDLSSYAGQTIQIGFEDLSKFGNIIALDNILIGGDGAQNLALATTANNGVSLQKTCDDQGWTYYADPADLSKSLLSIQWDPGNTGANASAKNLSIPKIQLDAGIYSSEDIPNKAATYTMARYWNVNLNGGSMTAPVNVRFFYTAAEKAAADAAAAAFATANSVAVKTPVWFKTNTGDFVPNAARVFPNGVFDATPLTNSNTGNATINGLLYAQFNGVTSFSGGTYAAGAGLGNILSVRLLNFNALLNRDKTVGLQWKVAEQTGVREYVVERSSDGRSFAPIGSIGANSQSSFTYGFTDLTPGAAGQNAYYRLRIQLSNGNSSYSEILLVRLQDKGGFTINPNPATETIVISYGAAMKQIRIVDMNGKLVMLEQLNGAFSRQVNIAKLQPGIYSVEITAENGLTGRSKLAVTR